MYTRASKTGWMELGIEICTRQQLVCAPSSTFIQVWLTRTYVHAHDSTPKVAIAMRVHNVQYITGRRALINPPAASRRTRCMLKFFRRSGDEKKPGPLIRLLRSARRTKHYIYNMYQTSAGYYVFIYVRRSSFNEIIKAFSC